MEHHPDDFGDLYDAHELTGGPTRLRTIACSILGSVFVAGMLIAAIWGAV